MTGSALSSYLTHGWRWWTVYPFWNETSRGLKLGPLAFFWYLNYQFGRPYGPQWSLAVYLFRRVIR